MAKVLVLKEPSSKSNGLIHSDAEGKSLVLPFCAETEGVVLPVLSLLAWRWTDSFIKSWCV